MFYAGDCVHHDLLRHHQHTQIQDGSIHFAGSETAELDALIDSMMFKAGPGHPTVCKVCGKSGKYRSNLRRHIESMHIDSPGFECPICGKVLKTRLSLWQHRTAKLDCLK